MLVLEAKITGEQQVKGSRFYRYLGLIALIKNPETSQGLLWDQVSTELAESLDGPLSTGEIPIELSVGDALFDRDGNNMGNSLRMWAAIQQKRADDDPRLQWCADIAKVESEEHEAVVRFIESADIGQSMVVISPFPEEAYQNTQTRQLVRQEGYRQDLRRSFIRVYEKTEHGVNEHIQSFDSSSLELWNATLDDAGMSPAQSTLDLLAQRFVVNTDPKNFIEFLRQSYDDRLQRMTDKEHRFGVNGASIEANNFVRLQKNIVEDTIKELYGVNSTIYDDKEIETIFYKSKALLDSLYSRYLSGQKITVGDQEVRAMRQSEGSIAAGQGKEYGGCSGSNGIRISGIASQDSLSSSLISFSASLSGVRRGKYIYVPCITCPGCKREGTYPYDPNKQMWASCVHKDCSNYNSAVMGGSSDAKKNPQKKRSILEDCFEFWGIKL